MSFVGEPATFNGGTPEEVHGRDAVAEDWAPYFQANGPRLTWKPAKAEILGHGDLGYTVGSWERLGAPVPAGGVDMVRTVTRGNYLTVWKKQADGAWADRLRYRFAVLKRKPACRPKLARESMRAKAGARFLYAEGSDWRVETWPNGPGL